jgi:flagellar basal body rod protein FlgG
VEFPNSSAVEPAGGAYYSGAAKEATPAIASSVQQGMLEGSNINPVNAMVGLISAQRQAEMVQRAMSAFYSDFNRIAADELPRI